MTEIKKRLSGFESELSPSSILGIIVEHMLRDPADNPSDLPLSIPNLKELVSRPSVSAFMTALTTIIDGLNKLYAEHRPKYDVVLGVGHLVGHPDIVSGTHFFEVKWTTQLKQNYNSFLLQLFCYGAMEPRATHLHLVLPSQSTIMTWDLKSWTKRELFRRTIIDLSEQIHTKFTRPNNFIKFQIVASEVGIGHHIGRKNSKQTLCQLVLEQRNKYPTQLFLSGHATSKTPAGITDADIAIMNDHITRNNQRIYVHAPYLINLCAIPGTQGDYFTKSLAYNLDVAAAIGFLGVVVHTMSTRLFHGKYGG
jgi:hypothetical protein